MRTLLVIAPTNALTEAIRAAVDAGEYRVIEQAGLRGDELRSMAASIDACVVDVDLTSVEAIRNIERYRRLLPRCPMILYASHSQWEWEEDAYLLGVSHILSKPVRGRLLHSLLERILSSKPAAAELRQAESSSAASARERGAAELAGMPGRMLELLRNCSSILCHSLSAEPLLKEFVLLLREILRVNRAVIFLRRPANVLGRAAIDPGADRLYSACAVGISSGVLEQFQLSLDSGIASYLFKSGRVLRRESDDAERDPQIRSEFDLLGTRVAIPVLDRESLVGVALFDGRVTGEPMTNEELALIFHLLEQLGLAIKNIWWHDQVSARHQMMFDILGQIKSGCVVVGRELNVLHANDIIREYFPRANRAPDAFDFADLPQAIGSKVFESLKTGVPVPDFKFQPSGSGQTTRRFRVSISPFRKDHSSAPTAALVVVEDCTAADRIQNLEIETANLRLVRQMAERLAHEIGNAVVPISTHQQLLRERVNDPDFQKSLATAMEDGVKRVSRLVDQMRFLARDRLGKVESVPVKQLIEEAFREARAYHPTTTVLLQYESSGEPLSLSCDRQGLQHAFAEIILNALQANTSPSQVQVRTRSETDSAGSRWAQIEVQDSGAGFTDEAAGKASEPFFTTRKVGLGLGLAVTSKIIQTHSGKMEIPTPHRGSPGLVRISLPLDPPAMSSTESSAN